MTTRQSLQQRSLRWLGMLALIGGFGVGLACSSPDLNGPTSLDTSQLYWTMALNAHAITMSTVAPYDTLQLTATPRDVGGAPLVGAPAPTFTTSDSSVRVSPAGLLTARAARTNVQVVATLTYRGIRLADTAIVNVTATATPQAFGRLVFGLLTGDSVKIAAPNLFSTAYFPSSKTLQAEAQDPTGAPITEASVAFQSSDPLQATVPTITSGGTVRVTFPEATSRVGFVTVRASATVYGVTREDSVQLTITDPLFAEFVLQGSTSTGFLLKPSFPAVIGVGGIVWWKNASPDSLDIVFDDPTAASAEGFFFGQSSGDIAPFTGGPAFNFSFFRARRFLRAGTFNFHSVRAGVAGTIVVR